MEAAPNTWSGGSADPLVIWCSNVSNYVPNLLTGDTTESKTVTDLGAGYSNTQKILGGCTYGAANFAATYNGGGKSDWHLPSNDELNELYLRRDTVGGLERGESILYWSSSESVFNGAWRLRFTDGLLSRLSFKGNRAYVRPVRTF
jgi:hypothetical protein